MEDDTRWPPPPMDELEPRDPISDAPGGLQALGAEIAGERAIVASFFEGVAVDVNGGEVLARALRLVLRTISNLDDLDALIETHAVAFADYEPGQEQPLERTAHFNSYVALVDGAISEALEDLECSAEELFDYARAHHIESGEAQRLLTRLLAMADYAAFAKMMAEANERGGMAC